MSNLSTIQVKPVIQYPRVAQAGRTYLMTVDLQIDAYSDWPYEDEEYPVYCAVDSELFGINPIGEPVIVMHRFSGTYGEARFLIRATQNESQGEMQITLTNSFGVSIKTICLQDIQILAENSLEIHQEIIPLEVARAREVVQLNLASINLTALPSEIGEYKTLKSLVLSNNAFSSIPQEVSQLENLLKLNLSGNQITEVPEWILQLRNLKELNLSGNQLSLIPEVLRGLTNLSTFKCSNNKLPEIPDWLESLPNLSELDLRNNPLSIPSEILNSCSARRILRYCHELRSGEKRQLNEARLIFLGQGSVGKTSLIARLSGEQYSQQEPQTGGLSVRNWSLSINSSPVRLNVWDFGGQEIYHATHQFFLTNTSLYILVCNCRTSEDENRIEYWLELIETFGDRSPVIIVGNKSDEQPLDINREALRATYPNIKAILETSCATGHGIDELKAQITREISQLNNVYSLLPLTWFEVKEALENLDKDFITYSEYSVLCHDQGITEERSKEQLVDLLHNLGLVLNFRNHPILKDTNILNPDWVTTGIYALLSDETLKTKNKGILSPADLTRILNAERYPVVRHPYLTELIKEFQLGFPLPDTNPTKFLLPGLLPKDEPENTSLEGDILDFQYHYRILPENILSRFIVLTHEDIHEHIYWRSGVMLHYTEGNELYNIARVKADPEDKKIFISIIGKTATRRTFLAMLRKTFNKIHSSFANLEVTEWVPVPDHPDHPLLDYQKLLGLEKMGVADYPIGTLGIRVNILQLLDGYEPLTSRQQRRREEPGKEFREELDENRIIPNEQLGNIHINFSQTEQIQQNQSTHHLVSNTINQYGQGDNIAGDKVMGDKIRTQINNNQELTQAIRDIKALFSELDQSYDQTTPVGQMMIAAKTVEAIEGSPTIKKRLIQAVKSGSAAALEVAVDHPAVKPVIATIKGFLDA